jgi:hypothetical protein
MSDAHTTETGPGAADRDERAAALFAEMVLQQANLAMLLLGKIPHPQTGKTARDLEGAKMFIDQLEMLEVKTRGNLSRDEEKLLKQSLMSLHLAFVETVETPAPGEGSPAPAAAAAPPEPAGSPQGAPAAGEAPAADADPRKRFSKKY